MIEALLLPLGGLLVFVLAIFGTARALELAFPGLLPMAVDPWLRRSVAGLWLWSLLLFGLAFSGGYTPIVLRTLLLGMACLGILWLVRDLRGRGLPPTPVRHRSREGGWPGLPWTLALAACLVPLFAVAVNPTVSWDAAVYHLALPDLYLAADEFRPAPFLVYAHWPQTVELFFGAAMALADYRLAKALHFFFGLSTLLLLVRSVRGPGWARGLAAGLFLVSGVIIYELRVAYVDLALAGFVLAFFLLLEEASGSGRAEGAGTGSRESHLHYLHDLRYLLLAGAAAGLVATVKVSGPVLVLAVGLPFLTLRFSRRGLVWLALPAAVLWLPWAVRSALDTGNPVYPALYGVFGGPHWSAELARDFTSWQLSIGMGREPIDWLLLPWRVIVEGGLGYERFDGRLSPVWLVALPFALWLAAGRSDEAGRQRTLRARRALAASALYFVFWAATAQQMRFLIPILPLLALAAAEGAVEAARRLRRRSASPWLRPRRIGVVLAILWSAWMAWDHGRVLRAGVSHLRLYARAGFEMPPTPPRPVVFDAMETLPEGARVLLLNSNHLLHCPRECLVDSFFEASQISAWLRDGSPAELARRLRQRGVTHVAWSGPPLGAEYPAALGELLQRPDLATVVARPTPESVLWRLAASSESDGSR